MIIITKIKSLHNEAISQALSVHCIVSDGMISGTDEQIEAFMLIQNPFYQVQYNQRQHLNGRWNMITRKLDVALPEPPQMTNKILMSVSAIQSDKTVSTGFHPIAYESLKELAENMHIYAHSPSIFSPILRYDKYTNQMKWDYRRRLHNISFTGNMLVYDFDDGSLTFEQAIEIAKEIFQQDQLPSLIIRSKSDPKYSHDRFKMLIQTNIIYPAYNKDFAPNGYEVGNNYLEIYMMIAEDYGLINHMDKSTKDLSRLIARVTNSDEERREYVIIG